MRNLIKINSGLKTYDIADENGTVLSSFSFNPADTNIAKRYEKVMVNIQDSIEKLRSMDDTSDTNAIEQLDGIVYENINELFNANVAEKFFAIMGPFSPMEDGRFFLEVVLEAIGSVIERELGERINTAKVKASKYTSKYNKS